MDKLISFDEDRREEFETYATDLISEMEFIGLPDDEMIAALTLAIQMVAERYESKGQQIIDEVVDQLVEANSD